MTSADRFRYDTYLGKVPMLQPLVRTSYPCEWCGKETDVDEYVVNFGICEPCFTASYVQYMEEQSGPDDWLWVE